MNYYVGIAQRHASIFLRKFLATVCHNLRIQMSIEKNFKAGLETPISNKEKIAFKFLYLIWAICILIATCGGFSHYKADVTQSSLSPSLDSWHECKFESFQRNKATCKINEEICSKIADNECVFYQESFDSLVTKQNNLRNLANTLLNLSLVLFLAVTFLFYGVRWGITRRLKPFLIAR